MTMKKIKHVLKNNDFGKLIVSCVHCIESVVVPFFISDKKAVMAFYRRKTGRELDLSDPQTFSEKMNWYKLNHRDPLMQKCADKSAVREYVASVGYSDLLNEVYGVYEKVSQIDIEALPEQFVLKASHGSHMSYIVKDKKSFDWKKAKRMMESWLHQNIYWSGREWVYKDIPRRIIAEKYLEDESGELRDYKFFCFNGVPVYMQYDGERFTGKHYRNYYEMDKTLLNLDDDVGHNSNKPFPLEDKDFEKMKSIAADLSKPFQFVRTDFYLVNGKVYFGELTFFHNGGMAWFKPEKYDYIFGEHWNISGRSC